jgi:hypothetical protein
MLLCAALRAGGLAGGASFKLTPQRYLFMVGRGEYCLGMFDNGWQGTLLGGILVRNVLVQVRVCIALRHIPLHASTWRSSSRT